MLRTEYVIFEDVMQEFQDGLYCLFSSSNYRPHELLQEHIKTKDPQVLILDINHRWSSKTLQSNSRILRPLSQHEVIMTIQSLLDYHHPRLDFIYVDDLPIYFRDFYGRDRLYTQNMRLYTFCLSRLRKHSQSIPIFFVTYSNAFSSGEPIYLDQTRYYSTKIYELGGIKNTPVYHSL